MKCHELIRVCAGGLLAAVLLLCLLSGCGSVHSVTLSVIDSSTKEPVVGADVTVERVSAYFLSPRAKPDFPVFQEFVTDQNGVCVAQLITGDTFHVAVEREGYLPLETRLVRWHKDRDGDRIEFELHPWNAIFGKAP